MVQRIRGPKEENKAVWTTFNVVSGWDLISVMVVLKFADTVVVLVTFFDCSDLPSGILELAKVVLMSG